MPAKSATNRRMETTVWGTQPDHAIDQLFIKTIRTLAMDAVQQPNSRQPTAPMTLAPLVYTAFDRTRFASAAGVVRGAYVMARLSKPSEADALLTRDGRSWRSVHGDNVGRS